MENEFLAQVLDAVADPIFVKDAQHRWLHLNDACCRFMGLPRELLLGKTDRDFFPREQADEFWRTDDETFASGSEMINEEPFTDACGRQRIISTKKSLLRDPRTGEMVLVGVIRDITETKLAAEKLNEALAQLKQMSNSDALTGLANRRHFLALAEHQWRIANRTGQGLALLFADMDNLKQINDELGHAAGDRALSELAGILRAVFRDCDAIARVGGDEFVVLLTGGAQASALVMTERLQEALRQRNAANPQLPALSLSVGAAFSNPGYPVPLAELLSRADQQMYEIKRARQGRSATPAMPVPARELPAGPRQTA